MVINNKKKTFFLNFVLLIGFYDDNINSLCKAIECHILCETCDGTTEKDCKSCKTFQNRELDGEIC